MLLPNEYQEVTYIQSSGTQYIKIGTQFKTSYKIVIDFQMTVTGGDYVPIGVRTADGGNKRYGIDVWNSYFKVIAGGGDWNNTIAEDTNRHTITLDKSTAIVDGTSYSVQYADYTFNDGIGVFYYHRIGETPDAISSNKLYKLDIYDENGTHINELIPCYRKSDGVIGLYDLVNSVFYTNSGTGTFTKGADVNGYKIKKVRIWVNNEEKQIYPAQTVQTFDFQNNGALGWTGYSIGYGTPDYVTGQGWNIGTSSSKASYQGGITIPNSVFQGELKSIKIYRYKPGATTSDDSSAVGICSQNHSTICEYSRFGSGGGGLTINGTRISAIDPTGEITTEWIMEDNGNLTVKINSTSYNIGSYASTFKNLRTNKTLYIEMGRWNKPAHYIRKIEIITKD